MFGQALAGAAKRGSQRLQELETRAYQVADRTTQRLINKYDEWDAKTKASKTAYMNAARKLKNLSNLNLDNGQIERILAGGLEGAENFIKAYENDKRLQFTAFDKEQKNKPQLPSSMMPDETADFAIPKPQFEYNKDIFLNKFFTRSDDYLAASEDDKKKFGRDLNMQSDLYAQSQNPFTAFDTLDREVGQVAEDTKSISGFGIPESYLESTVMKQLRSNKITAPEKIVGTLGENTGYAPLNYDMLDSTVKAEISANNLSEQVNKENFKKLKEENKYMALMNPLLLVEQNLKVEGLLTTNAYNKNRLEQSTIELNIAKLKTVDWAKAEMERAKKIQELEIANKEKQLKPNTVMEAIYDFNDQLTYWGVELKKNPNSEEAQRNIGIINSQMDKQFLLLARMKSAEKNERNAATLTNFYDFQLDVARTKNGHVSAISESTDPTNPMAALAVTERAHYLVPDPTDPSKMIKLYEGTVEYNEKDNELRRQVELGILKATGEIGGDGIWIPDDLNDRGLRLLVSSFDLTEDYGGGDYTNIDVDDYTDQFAPTAEKIAMDLTNQPNVTKENVVKNIMKIDRGLSYTDAEQMVNDAFSILERSDLTQAAQQMYASDPSVTAPSNIIPNKAGYKPTNKKHTVSVGGMSQTFDVFEKDGEKFFLQGNEYFPVDESKKITKTKEFSIDSWKNKNKSFVKNLQGKYNRSNDKETMKKNIIKQLQQSIIGSGKLNETQAKAVADNILG